MIWNHEDLWKKTQLYYSRAFENERESEAFPFWASLGLELLGRSTLAFIHPSLLADPQSGDNILYACGFSTTKAPKSVPVKTVFNRCSVIVPEFTEDEFKHVTMMMEKRNEELHSGELSFFNFPLNSWFPEFIRITNMLVTFQGKSLDELLGEEEADTASQVIQAINDKKQKEVFNIIKKAKEQFELLSLGEQEKNIEVGIKWAERHVYSSVKLTDCPSCGSRAVIKGDVVRYLQPKASDEYIIEKSIILPTSLQCQSCKLHIDGHSLLHAAGFGDQFTIEEEHEPKDYYDIHFDPMDYYEPDYGND
ncbi:MULTISPECIES: hypothetical protein [Paenibacillus]|uniref:hypothetical protein n=1 Tax=Paenibacillus TaxID=44249 RepID=UPI001B0B9586|nr:MULTISPECIES: hypothetical protein [Paenibacillus]UYO06445.1 hypothetical protein K2F33_11485 [Paenibacillus sp. PSB04]GIO64070.1 hypothetical protein J43TS9_56440 [Paenibacillus cineris]